MINYKPLNGVDIAITTILQHENPRGVKGLAERLDFPVEFIESSLQKLETFGYVISSNGKYKMFNVDKKTIEESFILLFNRIKKEVNGRSGVRILSKTDKNNLNALIEAGYTTEDFEQAIREMLKADWPKRTGNQTPAHLLRIDNFQKYLEMSREKKPEFKFNTNFFE